MESRKITSEQFHDNLLEAIRLEGVEDEIIIGIPDQMIENWILADKHSVKQYCEPSKAEKMKSLPDGFNGSSHLEFLLESYHKTTTGVALLKNCCPEKMCHSPSFNTFFHKIRKLNCWWINNNGY